MDGITSILAYGGALAVAAAIPGPGVAALVGQSLGHGLRAALFFLAGIALGDLVYLTVAVAGLAALAQVFAGALVAIKILGGLYLCYLAYAFWTSRAGLTEVRKPRRGGAARSFLSGFAVTLGNPKTVIFYLALLPTVIDLGRIGAVDWAILCVVSILVLILTLAPYAILASRARGAMTNVGALTRLNRLAGTIIGAAGLLILGEAARAVLRRA